MSTDLPHSAEYFGEQRDYWWHHDFLRLMAKRWVLPDAPRMLDVGCGVGHWGRLMLSLVSQRASLVAVDREARWVSEATRRATELGLGDRVKYQQGDATALDFEPGSFDVVTCQTVLIHLKDPERVLAKWRELLRPGGLLIVAEPQNAANQLLLGKTRFHSPVKEVVDLAGFQLTCERGKEALGEGNNSIGELVPGMFARLGLSSIQVYQNDQASPLIPPYAGPAQQAQRAQSLDWDEREFWVWSREETHTYFLAGGGTEPEFERLWTLARETSRRVATAIRAGTEEQTGAGFFFLISGRKQPG